MLNKKGVLIVLPICIICILFTNYAVFGASKFENEYFSIDSTKGFSVNKTDTGCELVDDENWIEISVEPWDYNMVDRSTLFNEDTLYQIKGKFEENSPKTKIIDQKISVAGKNKYDCFIFNGINSSVASIIKMHLKLYIFTSNNYTYRISIVSDKEDYFYSDKVIDIVNSFTIKDAITEYKPITQEENNTNVKEESSKLGALWYGIISGFFVFALWAIIAWGIKCDNRKEKKRLKKEPPEKEEDKELNNLIEILSEKKDKK